MQKECSDRRAFLRAGLGSITSMAAALCGADACAKNYRAIDEPDPNAFVFSRVKFRRANGDERWSVSPEGDENLLRHISNVTNIKISKRSFAQRLVDIDDTDKLYTTPLLFMVDEQDFYFTDRHARALGEFFKRGGFLYADDCDYGAERMLFYDAYVREVKKCIPGCEMKPLSHDHELYHCFYDLPNGSPNYFTEEVPGRNDMQKKCPDAALYYKDRIVSFATAINVRRFWARLSPEYYEEGIKLGTNIIVYALTH